MNCPKCGAELAESIIWEDGRKTGTLRSCACGFRQNVPAPKEEPKLPRGQGRLEI